MASGPVSQMRGAGSVGVQYGTIEESTNVKHAMAASDPTAATQVVMR
jgi:hypothetical protein